MWILIIYLISNDMMGYGYLTVLAHNSFRILWEQVASRRYTYSVVHNFRGFADPWNHILDLKLKTPAWETQRVVESHLTSIFFRPCNIGVSYIHHKGVGLYSSFCLQNSTPVSRGVLAIIWHSYWNPPMIFLPIGDFYFYEEMILLVIVN